MRWVKVATEMSSLVSMLFRTFLNPLKFFMEILNILVCIIHSVYPLTVEHVVYPVGISDHTSTRVISDVVHCWQKCNMQWSFEVHTAIHCFILSHGNNVSHGQKSINKTR